MITISDLSLNFSGEPLFKDVNLKFTEGNCYGVIGANGAGKSTFLRILSGDLDPSTGTVSIAPKTRMSVLKQDHFAFNDETVLNTVLGGNPRLLEVMREKDALYMKDPFTEEDGNKAAELEAEFAEMGGWDAETEAGQLLNGLGLDADAILYTEMKNLGDVEKVKVLLARCLASRTSCCSTSRQTIWISSPSAGWRTFWQTLRVQCWSYRMTVTSSITFVPTSWTLTTVRSSSMSATTSSGMNPRS